MRSRLPKGYLCRRARSPLVIDGRLDDEAWEDAAWTNWFVDIEGAARPRPRFGTRAKLLWDDRYLYIGAWLEEPHVWGTLTEHDSVIFQDNDFEVFIDPDGDNHDYYEIEINALNAEWDLRLTKPYRDSGKPIDAWEIPGIQHAVWIDGTLNDPSDIDRGWSVEFALPWEALAEYARRPAPPCEGDQWRINFSRVEWLVDIIDGVYRKRPGTVEDNWVWSPQGAVDMHRPECWGFVQFTHDPPGKGRFRRDPRQPLRDALMLVYHAQVAHRRRTGAWTATLSDLGVITEAPVTLRLTKRGWEAEARTSSGAWRVREDSRLWFEEG